MKSASNNASLSVIRFNVASRSLKKHEDFVYKVDRKITSDCQILCCESLFRSVFYRRSFVDFCDSYVEQID